LGGLVVVASKKRENVVPKLIKMLEAIKHRGKDGFNIITKKDVIKPPTIQELQKLKNESNIAIGQNFIYITPNDILQQKKEGNIIFAFEGRPYCMNKEGKIIDFSKKIENKTKIFRLAKELKGPFVFALLQQNQIVVGRDPVGTIPFYYSEDDNLFALASEQKALKALNMKEIKSFPLGNLALIDKENLSFRPFKTITKPTKRFINEEQAKKKLYKILLKSIEDRTKDSGKVALAFSGGLDSGLIAKLAKQIGTQILLVSVGLRNQIELKHAESMAKKLNLPIRTINFTIQDLEKNLLKVLWLIEEPSVLKLSVGFPLFWVAKKASKMGYKVLLAGHGSDELFGGYNRYLNEYKQHGAKTLEDVLFNDALFSHKVNFEYNNKICSFHGIELRLPFSDLDLINFSLRLPLCYKIKSSEDSLRKIILRKLGNEIGLPPEVYKKPKKAVQYSTGVDKLLRKIAKKEGKNLKEYVENSFRRIKKTNEI
jgi:asparagine synthase (glutamine-hydrolysing)